MKRLAPKPVGRDLVQLVSPVHFLQQTNIPIICAIADHRALADPHAERDDCIDQRFLARTNWLLARLGLDL